MNSDPLDLWSEARARQRQADAIASLAKRERQAAARARALDAAEGSVPLAPNDPRFYRWTPWP